MDICKWKRNTHHKQNSLSIVKAIPQHRWEVIQMNNSESWIYFWVIASVDGQLLKHVNVIWVLITTSTSEVGEFVVNTCRVS